jgi:hypothetical protein
MCEERPTPLLVIGVYSLSDSAQTDPDTSIRVLVVPQSRLT